MNPVPAVTYSPKTRKFYRGALETGVDFDHDSSYEPVAKLNLNRKMGDGRLEFEAEVARAFERQQYSAVSDTSVSSTVTVVELLTEVINREWRNFYAIEGTTRIPVPKLQLTIPVQTKYAASQKVPELVEATMKESTWATTAFALWKNVAHVAVSDEAVLRGNIDLLSFDIDQAAGALASAANSQIVTAVESFGTAAKGDWGAMNSNGDFSNRNPLDDITTEFNNLAGSSDGIRPDTLTMHPRVASDYLSNTFINGYMAATDRQLMGAFPLPKFPGITAIVDPGFSSTKATLYDRRGLLLGEGPTVAEQYRDPKAGYNGYIIRQYLQPLKVDNIFGKVMTSVSA